MKKQKLTVTCNGKRYKLHPHDIKKLSKLIKFTTPLLPAYYEEYSLTKVSDPQFVETMPSSDIMDE